VGSDRINLYWRAGILVLSAASGALTRWPPNLDFLHPTPWYFLLEIGAFGVLAIPLVLSFSAASSRGPDKWRRPSWFASPFEFKQPTLLFELGAHCLISYGVGCAIYGTLDTPIIWAWEIPFAAGCGIWLGVRVSMLVYRGRFEPMR
jgi:hypothetical protein